MFNWDNDHQIIDEWNHYSPPLSYKMLFFMFSVKTLRAEHRRPPWGPSELLVFSDTWTPTAAALGWSCSIDWTLEHQMLSGEAVKPPPPSLSSSPPLKKERINLCRALCHLESDTSREAGQEGDQRGALQPGDGHSIRGGDQGWGEIGSRWLVIPWRLIPQGPAMRIWYW